MIHRLVEPGGEKYLPLAESQLSLLRRALGGADFARVLKHGGYTIQVRRAGGQEFIHIEGAQRFEFYTSGWPVTTTSVTQGSVTTQTYEVGIVSASAGGRTFSPRFVGGKKLSYASGRDDARTFGRPNWQVQLGQIPFVDVRESGPGKRRFRYTLAHVAPPTTGHSFAHVLTPFWSGYEGILNTWIGEVTLVPTPWNFSARDVGYDVLNWRMAGNTAQGGVSEALAPDSDWPRVWGVQEVSAIVAGTPQTFLYGIYVDAQGAWYAFPLEAMGTIAAGAGAVPLPNLTSANSRKVMPAYPAWVWRGDSAASKLKDQIAPGATNAVVVGARSPDLHWEFNPMGTRAVAMAHARVDFGAFNNSWYTKPSPSAPDAPTASAYDTTCRYNSPWTIPAGMSPFAGGLPNGYETWASLPRHFAGPGVIEAMPVITKGASADPNDFTFAVTVNAIVNPLTDAVDLPLAAGYLWHAPEGGQAAVPGDLLVLEAATYSNFAGAGSEHVSGWALRLRNATTGATVFSGMQGRVRGMDLRTLSFYMQSAMATTNGPSYTIARGDYYPGQPVPSGYAASYTGNFIVARPFHYVVVKGKLARVFLPEDIPTALQTTAATVAAYTLDDLCNAPPTMPLGATELKLNTRWTAAALRAGDSYAVELETKLAMWFGLGVQTAVKWADPPASLAGYPVGWMRAAVAAHSYLSIPVVDSTFYVHPNGSWAVFDTNTFYNTLGVPQPETALGRVCNTGALLSAGHFQWFPVDAVEIKRLGSQRVARTTFTALYNQAQAQHAAERTAAGGTPDFQPLVLSAALPTFTLHQQYVQNYTTPAALGTNEFTLGIHWSDGSVLYRRLPSYHTGGMLFPDLGDTRRNPAWPGWCLIGDAGDMMFTDAACTQLFPVGGMHTRYTFRISSPRLIAAPKGA